MPEALGLNCCFQERNMTRITCMTQIRLNTTLRLVTHALSVTMLAVCAMLLTATAQAAEPPVGLSVVAPWVRASVPGQVNGAGYVQITNTTGLADKLIGVKSEVASRVELHTVLNEQGVSKMRQVTEITLLPNNTTSLAPGGYHIMFLNLKRPFIQDATVPVTLQFENAGEVLVRFEVKPSTYNPGGNAGHGSHQHTPGMAH
jgi:copper(I)-binding protein